MLRIICFLGIFRQVFVSCQTYRILLTLITSLLVNLLLVYVYLLLRIEGIVFLGGPFNALHASVER